MHVSKIEPAACVPDEIIYHYRLWPTRGYEYVSPSVTELIGHTPEEHYSDPDFGVQHVHPDDREQLENWMRGVIAGKPLVLRWQHKHGGTVRMEQRSLAIRNESRDVVAVVGVARKMAEWEAGFQARDRHSEHAALVDWVRDAIISTDNALRILSWNRAAQAIYGWSAREVVGRNVREVLQTEFPDGQGEVALPKVDSRGHWEGRVVQRCKDNSRVHIYSSVSGIWNRAGERTGLVAVNRDITDIMRLEAELLQAQKLEAIGRLASHIAHDFNNLLMVMNGTADIFLHQLPEGSPLRVYAFGLKRSVASGTAITRQILDFSRKQDARPGAAIDNVIAEMALMMRSLLGDDVDVSLHLGAPGSGVCLERGRIEQILMNLVANARDAMSEGGRLTIATSAVDIGDIEERERDEATPGQTTTRGEIGAPPELLGPGRYVVLEVRDTGCGMDQTTLDRAFEPFFTTKAPGKGTGLGMASIYNLVKGAGGQVYIASEVGAGTTMRLYLPWCSITENEEDSLDASEFHGTETVLLVEDHSLVRTVVHYYLDQAGYRVLCAENPRQAQALCRQSPEHIDVLLADIVMPDMPGPQLARELEKRYPAIKTVYMSATGTGDLGMWCDYLDETRVLNKPFSSNTLLSKLREVLDMPAGEDAAPAPVEPRGAQPEEAASFATDTAPCDDTDTAPCDDTAMPFSRSNSRARDNYNILLVEDDETSRLLLHDFLQDSGYQVVSVGSVSEALSYFRSQTIPDIVVTDMNLPDKCGIDLIYTIHNCISDIPILCMSGYSVHDSSFQKLLGVSGIDFLQKPVSIAELLGRIKRLLAQDTRPTPMVWAEPG